MVDFEKMAKAAGVDWKSVIAESKRQEQEWRDAGMIGEHPHFKGFAPGEFFDENGILRDANGYPLEVSYTLSNGTKIYFPLRREKDLKANGMSPEAFRNWRHDVRGRCFRRFKAYEHCEFGGLFDDATDSQAVKACFSYANDFPALSKAGLGLILYGACGTGKTHLAACICNAVIDQGKRALMANAQMLSDEGAKKFGGLTPMLEELGSEYQLIVIDDYGRENNWSKSTLFECVDYFYANRISLIVTTNMSGEHLARPTKQEAALIERLKERCNRVQVIGRNRRQMIASGHVE